MDNNKISSYSLYVMVAVSAVTFVMSFMGNHDPMLYLTYIFTILGIALWLITALFFTVTNPKNIKSTLMGLGAFLVIGGISYGLASDEVIPAYEAMNVTPMVSKLSDAGLISMYILSVGAIGAILLSGVVKMIK